MRTSVLVALTLGLGFGLVMQVQSQRGGPPPFQGPGRGGRGGLGAIVVPASNPLTPEKIALGRQLFFDTELSQDRSLSCGSCHQPAHGFSDGRALAVGIHDSIGTRHTPALIDAGSGRSFFWDGRASSLEDQVLQPIYNPVEMGLSASELESRTGRPATDVANALASYVRTIRSQANRYDWYLAGDYDMLSAEERAGLRIFAGKGGCLACHGGPNLTDDRFHNTGAGVRDGVLPDPGRFAVSGDPRDHGAFKTPSLRNIALSAPYMHDGSLPTLEAVVDFYSSGGIRNRFLDPRMHPLNLTKEEKQSLVAFLRALSSPVSEGLN